MWNQAALSPHAVTLRTQRMVIRPCMQLDPVAYSAMLERNRDHIGAYMPDEVLGLDAEGVTGFFASLTEAWEGGDALCLAGTDAASARFLVQIYVQALDKAAGVVEIGYFSERDSQGKGYVAEALREVARFLFEEVGVHKICLVCDDTNAASVRVAERCGYTLEGVLRRHTLNKDGSRPDRRFYGRLHDD